MGTIIVTVIILAAVVAAFLWTRSSNRKAGGSCSKQAGGCAGCSDTSCPASMAVEKNKYDDLATFRPKYDAVFFDLDGTLLDTSGDLTDAVNHVLESEGLSAVTKEEVIPVLGNGVIDLLHTFLPDDISEAEFEDCYNRFKNFYNKHFRSKTFAYAGVKPLLERIKNAGFKTAVITNKNDDTAKLLVNDFFPGLIDRTLGRTEFIKRKPDPGMMRFVASETEIELHRILYVGDSEVDNSFARAAGTDCLLVSWGFRGREFLQELNGVTIVDTPREILGVAGLRG